jgi:hypothetical protein
LYWSVVSLETPDSEINPDYTGQEQYQAAYAKEPGAPWRKRVQSFDDKQEAKQDRKDCKNIPAHLSFPPLSMSS